MTPPDGTSHLERAVARERAAIVAHERAAVAEDATAAAMEEQALHEPNGLRRVELKRRAQDDRDRADRARERAGRVKSRLTEEGFWPPTED
jgi:hypothetical protein